MGIKHTQPNYYLTQDGDTTNALLNGNSLDGSGNTLPNVAANYLMTFGEGEGYGVVLPDAVVMDGQFITFVAVSNDYEGGFQIISGSAGGGSASIGISSASEFSLSVPSSVTLLADAANARWWITSFYTD